MVYKNLHYMFVREMAICVFGKLDWLSISSCSITICRTYIYYPVCYIICTLPCTQTRTKCASGDPTCPCHQCTAGRYCIPLRRPYPREPMADPLLWTRAKMQQPCTPHRHRLCPSCWGRGLWSRSSACCRTWRAAFARHDRHFPSRRRANAPKDERRWRRHRPHRCRGHSVNKYIVQLWWCRFDEQGKKCQFNFLFLLFLLNDPKIQMGQRCFNGI